MTFFYITKRLKLQFNSSRMIHRLCAVSDYNRGAEVNLAPSGMVIDSGQSQRDRPCTFYPWKNNCLHTHNYSGFASQ